MQTVLKAALTSLAMAGCSSGGGSDSTTAATPAPGSPASTPTNPAANTPPPSLPAPSALFVLGDSWSDVGNAASAADYLLNLTIDPPTVGLCNPADVLVLRRGCDELFYGQSRVSDGPVMAEHLAEHLGLPPLKPSLHLLPARTNAGTVYAVASAKAREHGNEDLARQVDWLLLDHAPLDVAAVYVVMIGGNDALDALQSNLASPTANPPPGTAIVASSVTAIGTQIERLLDAGARRIVIANVPDLAALPAVRAAALATPDTAATLTSASAITVAFNEALAARLDVIAASGQWLAPTPPTILRFDLFLALTKAVQGLATRGGNVLEACFDSSAYRDSTNAVRMFHPACAPLAPDPTPRFDEFVFFDGIHPTGASHATFGGLLRALF